MSRPDEDTFLSRWSRRKRAPEPEPAPEAVQEPDPPVAEPEGPVEPADPPRTDAEILADLGLKDPDSMEQGDDFAAFLKSAVPEHLRRRALRRLWRSNPVLACVDGLNDYDTDFTGDTVAPGLLKSSYKAGSGYLRELVEAPQPEAEPSADEADVTHNAAQDPVETSESDQTRQTGEVDAIHDEISAEPPETRTERAETHEKDTPPLRRRMKFRISEG